MNERTAQLLAVGGGLALIVLYSGLMIAAEGGTGWAWILLVAGIALLVGGGRMMRRNRAG